MRRIFSEDKRVDEAPPWRPRIGIAGAEGPATRRATGCSSGARAARAFPAWSSATTWTGTSTGSCTWWTSPGRDRGPSRSGGSPRAGQTRSAESSEHPAAQRDVQVGGEEHHLARLVRHSEDEHLALETCDPVGWEVHHRDHLPSDEALRVVVGGELGAGPLLADLWPEVHYELYRGLAGLRERLGRDYPPDPYVYLLEVFPCYLGQSDLLG